MGRSSASRTRSVKGALSPARMEVPSKPAASRGVPGVSSRGESFTVASPDPCSPAASDRARSVQLHAGSSAAGMGMRAMAVPAASVVSLMVKRGRPPSTRASSTGVFAAGVPEAALLTSTQAETELPGTTRVSATCRPTACAAPRLTVTVRVRSWLPRRTPTRSCSARSSPSGTGSSRWARPAASAVVRTAGGADVTPGPRCAGSQATSTTAPASGASVTAVGNPKASTCTCRRDPGAAPSGTWRNMSRPRAAASAPAVCASDTAAEAHTARSKARAGAARERRIVPSDIQRRRRFREASSRRGGRHDSDTARAEPQHDMRGNPRLCRLEGHVPDGTMAHERFRPRRGRVTETLHDLSGRERRCPEARGPSPPPSRCR